MSQVSHVIHILTSFTFPLTLESRMLSSPSIGCLPFQPRTFYLKRLFFVISVKSVSLTVDIFVLFHSVFTVLKVTIISFLNCPPVPLLFSIYYPMLSTPDSRFSLLTYGTRLSVNYKWVTRDVPDDSPIVRVVVEVD